MPLNGEDQFQVLGFVPVIQKTVVTDLLETGRKDMHQVPADKFRMAQSDVPARIPGLSAAG